MSHSFTAASLQAEHPDVKLACVEIDIARPPHAVYDVITDFGSYPDFVPNQNHVRVVDDGEDRWTVRYETSLFKKISYELEHEGVPGQSMRWRLRRGDMMRDNVGGWILEERPDGTTRATLNMALVLGVWLPKSLVHKLVSKTCRATAEAIKREAERRAAG